MTVFPCKLRIVTEIVKAAPTMDLAECIDTSLHLAAMIAKSEVGRDDESAARNLAGLTALYDRRDVLEGRKVERCGTPPVEVQVSPLDVDGDPEAPEAARPVPQSGPPTGAGDIATIDAIQLARAHGVNLASLSIRDRTITRADVDRYMAAEAVKAQKAKKGAA